MSDKKKFGLIMPKKAETFKMRTNSLFNDESDDDEVNKRPKIPQKKLEAKSKIKIEFLDDPSIYEYDSIYDEMKAKQTESIAPKEKKNSRYIETLLKAADKRKKEYERRIDKKIQVEREKEGDKFKDKEAFVTTSYKKKMQEKEEEEERERRENMLNDMMDVTKQKDLSGFYRHFLNQTIGEENVPIFGEKQIKKEIDSDQDDSSNKITANVRDNKKNYQDCDDVKIDDDNSDEKQDIAKRSERTSGKRLSGNNEHKNKISVNVNDDKNIDEDSDGIEIDDDDDVSENQSSDENSDIEKKSERISKKKISENKNQRHKRKKQVSDSDESQTIQLPKRSRKHSRKNAESSDSETRSNDGKSNETVEKNSSQQKQEDKNSKTSKHKVRHDSSSDDENSNNSADVDAKSTSKSETHLKKNIYAKRTIGEVLVEAQARYFQRLAARESGI